MDIATTGHPHQMAMMPFPINYTGNGISPGTPQFNGYSQSASFENVQNIPNFVHNQNPYMQPPIIHPGMIQIRHPNIPNYTQSFHHPPNIRDRSLNTKHTDNRLNQNHQSHHNQNPSSIHPPFQHKDKTFVHRDGVDHGWGWSQGHGGGNGSVGNSPAISALALLGFLFFLNLIQNSLQNNRNMLTTTTTTTTTNMTTTAGSSIMTINGRSGRERQKRDSDYYSFHRYTPVSIPSHPIRPIQLFLENRENDQPQFHQPVQTFSYTSDAAPETQNKDIRSKQRNTEKTTSQNSSLWSGLMKQIENICSNCLKLLACNFGRGVIKKFGKPTALILRSMGRNVLPATPETHWSSRILRAVTDGWNKSNNCNDLYKCTPLNFMGT